MKQNEKKEQLKVNIQYIKDLSFENQNSPDSLSNKGEAPAINVDIKLHNKVIDLQLHKRNYKCQITEDMKIKITNTRGQFLRSEIPVLITKDKENNFAKKILSFAEIALGKTA